LLKSKNKKKEEYKIEMREVSAQHRGKKKKKVKNKT